MFNSNSTCVSSWRQVAKISCKDGGDSHLGIVEEELECYDDDDDDDDEEGGYWAALNARESGKTLHKLAFPSGTDEQL
jgi:hypothetical protein